MCMSNNRNVTAMLALRGLEASVSNRAVPVANSDGLSLGDFARAVVNTANGGAPEHVLVSGGNNALAQSLNNISDDVAAGNGNGSFWGDGDNMTINISLGTGRVSVVPNS